MHFNRPIFLLPLLVLAVACSKTETASTTTVKGAIDTTQKAEPVAITDTNHHLYFHPKAGSVQHYHIVDKMAMNSNDVQGNSPAQKHSASSTTEFFIQQTVKAVNLDSSVILSFRVDSLRMDSQRDTSKVHYASSNMKDRMNEQYREFNMLLGKDFSVRANKWGDLDSMVDVSAISNDLLSSVPDSLRKNPRVMMMARQQAEQVANAYVMRVLVHSPTRALVKDTTWRNETDVNLDIAPGLAFPVHVTATETVRGLEKRDDHVLAVLEDNTNTSPKKKVFEEGPTKASIGNFVATSHSVVRIEDATGLLAHRAMQEKRNVTLIVESKEHPEAKRTVEQNGSEELVTEMIE